VIIAHASDLHGNYKALDKVATPDLWVITGDFFPNYGRGPKTNRTIDPNFERAHQLRWWRYKATSVKSRLRGRPVLWVPGNHDFINLSTMLGAYDYTGDAYDVTTESVELFGYRFAGYREIPYLAGEWVGEVMDFQDIVQRTMELDPDILLTHAPPAGILDDDLEGEYGHGVGVTAQTQWYSYREHRVTHHFFGHIHAQGGKTHEEMGVKFINSATCVQIIELPDR
jgi:Icc-related predicted phosphoesterase